MDEEDYITTEVLVASTTRVLLSLDHFDIPTRPQDGINPHNTAELLGAYKAAIHSVLERRAEIDAFELEELLLFARLIAERIDNCSTLVMDVFQLQQDVVEFYMDTFAMLTDRVLRLELLSLISSQGATARAALELAIIDGDRRHISNAVEILGRMIDHMLAVLENQALPTDKVLELRDSYDGLFVSAALAGAR